METRSSRNQKPKTNPPRTDIPDDIFFHHLLLRLPAKSLVRFKSVCRKWNSDISSLKFAHAHLRHPSRRSSSLESVIAHQRKAKGKVSDTLRVVTLDYQRLTLFRDSRYVIKLSFPFNYLLASCNGLALFISSVRECKIIHCATCKALVATVPCVHRHDFRYVVCNPFLGVGGGRDVGFHEIEHPNDILLGGTECVLQNDLLYNFGFAYVSSTDDYCIFVVNMPRNPKCPDVVVHAYSIRSQEWKVPLRFKQRILPLKFGEPWYERVGILVKETLYWGVSQGKGDLCIAAFDLATQDGFKLMELQYSNLGEVEREYSALHLCCMDDCLSACATYARGDAIRMWKMEEHDGLYVSWTEIFHVNFVEGNLLCRDVFGFSKSQVVLIFTDSDDKLSLVDINSDQPQSVTTVLENIFNAMNYVRSLVSVRALI